MKKIFLVLITASIFLLNLPEAGALSRSPIKKGGFWAAGSFDISSFSGDLFDDSSTGSGLDIMMNPGLHYFLEKGFALGGEFNIDYSNRGDSEIFGIGLGPSLRYFYSPGLYMYPYIGAGIVLNSYSVEGSDNYTATDISFTTGNIFMLNAYIGLNVQAQYKIRLYSEEDGDSKTGNILSLMLGFAVFL